MAEGDVVDLNDGSPEGHTAKMLAMSKEPELKEGDEGYVAPSATPRPDNVPEKFWDTAMGIINTDALLKSQADGEAAIALAQSDGTVVKKVELKEGDEGYVAPTVKPEDVANANPKVVADASAEFTEKGELSEATYTALEGAGLSKGMVDDYITGQKAIVSKLQDAAYAPFEGADGYNEAANWAATAYTEDEVKALDVQLMSNNPAIVAQGAKALQTRYAAEADLEPNTIRGNSNNPATGGVYKSSREMMKDMNTSTYRTSAAFRAEVAAKLGRSNI